MPGARVDDEGRVGDRCRQQLLLLAAMFDRLGLFAGPFTADLTEAVARDAGLDERDAGKALRLLVDSSLVVTEPGAGTMRFRLFQTVRSFALQRLREQGTLDTARRQLADHVVQAARDVVESLGGQQWDPAVINNLVSLYDTVESTVRWCLAGDTDPRRALQLCGVLLAAVHHVHTDEIRSLCDAVLERWPDPSLPGAADAAATASTARYLVGDPRGALAVAERALPTAEPSPTAPTTLRRAMAYAVNALGDRRRAVRLLGEVSALARERGLVAFASRPT